MTIHWLLTAVLVLCSLVALVTCAKMYTLTREANAELDRFLGEKALLVDADGNALASQLPLITGTGEANLDPKQTRRASLGVLIVFIAIVGGYSFYTLSGLDDLENSHEKTDYQIQQAARDAGKKASNGVTCVEAALRLPALANCKDDRCRSDLAASFAMGCLSELSHSNLKAVSPPCGMSATAFQNRFCSGSDLQRAICSSGPFSVKGMPKGLFYCPFGTLAPTQ